MPSAAPSGVSSSSMMGGVEPNEEQAAQRDELKRQMLSQILDGEARERCTSTLLLCFRAHNHSISNCIGQAAKGRYYLGPLASNGAIWPSETTSD